MSKTYYVYSHTSPSGKVYIGQTTNIKRRWGYQGEQYLHKKKDGDYVQRLFARAILKYSWGNFEHKILLEGISKSEADYAERYLIRWYKIHNLSYNISDGGEGTTGVRKPLSEERKAAIKLFMNTNHPMKGRKHTPEAMAKILYANRHRTYTPEQRAAMAERARLHNTGKTHSGESKKKMSEYKKSHPETWIGGWNKVEVHQYDLQGRYIASFPSAIEAAISLNKNIGSSICACIKGTVTSAGGFLWRSEKVNSIDVSSYKVLKTPKGARVYDISEKGNQKRSVAHGKAINQYSIDGKYIATYTSSSEAASKMGFNRSGIAKCCKQLPKYKTANGFIWRYDTIDNRKDILMNHDNDEANTIEREKMAETARQFNAKLRQDDKKLELEKQKQKDDVRIKEKQISAKKG